MALRIPYYLTHHIQEDTYITWRCAQSLHLTGIYGFNPGERVSATTSHLYMFICFIFITLAEEKFIPITILFNVCCLVAAAAMTARMLFEKKMWVVGWVIFACIPICLLISYTGMETSLLMFLYVTILFAGRNPLNYRPYGLLAMAALPWVRPDAVAIGGLTILSGLLIRDFRNSKKPIRLTIALLIGAASIAAFNYFYFGDLLNQTIVAKCLGHSINDDTKNFLKNLKAVFISNDSGGIYSPLQTKLAAPWALLYLFVTFVGFCLATVQAHKSTKAWITLAFLANATILPIFYAFSQVMFPWYFWPSTFCAAALLLAGLFYIFAPVYRHLSKYGKCLLAFGAGTVLFVLMLSQWAISLNWGTQEYLYRASIGRYLKGLGHSNATLFLESAGYIPFFSEMYTYDEAGLVSKQVLEYRKKYGENFRIPFIKAFRPNYIVIRDSTLKATPDDNIPLNKDDSEWFEKNYQLIKHFVYIPSNYALNPIKLEILKHGDASDYFLFQRKNVI